MQHPAITGDHMSMSDLRGVARLRPVLTRSISAENPTGAPGQGGRATTGTGEHAARELGQGWKVSPSVDIAAGAVFEVADISGAGTITHIWMTTAEAAWRTTLLRMYWDRDAEPAVEVPLGDFFAQGTGVFAQIDSQPISANPRGGLNSYWPMPFRTGARITLENLGTTPVTLYYQVTYEVGGEVGGSGYLHAQWRRSNPLAEKQTHVLLEGVEGQGQYVGTYIAWGANSNGWWGEGELKFYLDDDTDFPTIAGTGTEDYFGGAWSFLDNPGTGYATYSTPYLGMPQVIRPDGLFAAQTRFSLYRWHVLDPIHFAHGIRTVDVQALGWRSGGRYLLLRDDIASTALFYLDRTSTARPPAPSADDLEIDTGSAAAP
jgi:hypothetical protein